MGPIRMPAMQSRAGPPSSMLNWCGNYSDPMAMSSPKPWPVSTQCASPCIESVARRTRQLYSSLARRGQELLY